MIKGYFFIDNFGAKFYFFDYIKKIELFTMVDE